MERNAPGDGAKATAEPTDRQNAATVVDEKCMVCCIVFSVGWARRTSSSDVNTMLFFLFFLVACCRRLLLLLVRWRENPDNRRFDGWLSQDSRPLNGADVEYG